jgi:hypothetical protein
MISNELQIGKAGEYFVCYDLLKNGYNAYLTDAGLNYDILLDYNSKLFRIQVKTTTHEISTSKSKNIYRFGLRNGKKGNKSYKTEIDIIAFVALDIQEIAYMLRSDILNKNNQVKQIMEFLPIREMNTVGRIYSNGTRRKRYGKCISNFKLKDMINKLEAPEDI